MKKSITTILCSALASLCTITIHGAEQPDRPNIIFILADDLGYADLSSYGAEKIQTPNIDRLAKEGILFTDAHTECSTCTPTRYGLLTGRYCFRTWLKYSALSTSAPLLIVEDQVTVASFLKSAGYSTSIVGKWHLGFGREEGFEDDRGNTPPNYWETRGSGPNWNGELKPGPLEVGFGYSYVIPVANSFPPYVFVENHHVADLRKDSPIGKLESRNSGKMEGGEGARWKDEELVDMLTRKAVSQLESFAKQNKPFFLYYAPHQPHVPHQPNERFRGTSEAEAFGDVIQELDWSVGEILRTQDRLGLTENTLVVFSSDNGGYQHKFNGHQPNGHVLRGGKGDLVEGGHRVPFLARWPGRIKPGTRSKETISLTDMMATFAALIGKELPRGAGPDSYNVLPALLGKKIPDPNRPLVMLSGGTGALSIRAGKWKLIDGQGDCGYREFFSKRPHPTPRPGDPPAQLYNLEEDLEERNNLYLKHPEIVQRLKVGLEKIKADENYNPSTLELPDETLSIEQLNVLFIVVDDMGWRDLACYGHKIHETPHIDKLAADGMRFTNGYAACQVCSPTRKHHGWQVPFGTGITNWLAGDNYKDTPLLCERTAQFMKLEETTLAEALKAGGYQTAFVGKWHLGKGPYYPQHQGFDINVAGNHWGHPHKGYFSPYQMEHLEDGPKGEYLTDRLTSEAIRVMDDFSKKEKPWLMYMSYYTVHAPFHAKPEKVTKYQEKARRANVKLNANYAAMVDSLDENVGRVLGWLDEKELRKGTIIVFTSDNGGFHMATTNRPLRGHKGSLYDGGIRVPWIVQWPGVTRPGSVCNKPVISSDVYPTLLEMTGLPLRPKQHLDGVSLAPLLKGDADFDRGPMIWFYPHYLPRHHAEPGSAIRIGDWKLIQYYEDGRQELYNLKRDIGESDNLAKRMPERVAELKDRLDGMLKEHGAKTPAPNPAYKKKRVEEIEG